MADSGGRRGWRPGDGWRAYYAAQRQYDQHHRTERFLLTAGGVAAWGIASRLLVRGHHQGVPLYLFVSLAVGLVAWSVIRVTLSR